MRDFLAWLGFLSLPVWLSGCNEKRDSPQVEQPSGNPKGAEWVMWIPSVEQVGLIGGTIGGAAFIAFVIYTVISKDFKLGVRGIVAALACIAASAAVWWVGANLYWIGPVLGIATVVGALVAGALAVWVHIKKIEVWLGWDITGDGKVG